MKHKKKYSEFIKMCNSDEVEHVFVAFPSVLGDDYNEIIENLSLIAQNNKILHIGKGQDDE